MTDPDPDRPRWAAGITDADTLKDWLQLEEFLTHGWGEDLGEELGAWLSGRAYRRRFPDKQCPDAKEVGVYRHNQTARFVWQSGWVYEHKRMAMYWNEFNGAGETRRLTTQRTISELQRRIGLLGNSDVDDGELAAVEERMFTAAWALGIATHDLKHSWE
jgi:hypothetical protein